MYRLLRAYFKTAAMTATSELGENALFLLTYLMRLLRVILLLSVWRLLLTGKGEVSGLGLADVLTYTFIAEVFSQPLACRTNLEGAFWDGSITTRFLRPMGIFAQFAVEMMGRWPLDMLLFSLPLLLLAPWLGVQPLPATPLAGFLFLVSLGLGVGVGLGMEYLFSAIAVGLDWHPYAINSVRNAMGSLLAGRLIPLALFPWGLGKILDWLPFASLASAPLRIYTGKGNPLWLLTVQLFWCLMLWPLAHRLWLRYREKMVGRGG